MHMDRHMYRYIHITQALAFATEAAREVLQGARFWPAYGPERVWQCVGVQSRLETQSA